jgi:hypothetical protein
MFANVATPATAGTVVVPESVAPPGFAPRLSETDPLNDETRWPVTSFATTTIEGEIGAPATAVTGCALIASCVAIARGAVESPPQLSAMHTNATPQRADRAMAAHCGMKFPETRRSIL